ncbi:MAG: ABC transporter permease [Microthrixaceae bacterium]|nr:ABC transporter permease [Microthrixaceae bacterium]
MIVVVLARRTIHAVGSLLGGAAITFLLLAVTPGDPAERVLLAKGRDSITAADIAAQRKVLGLDEPLPVRLWEHLSGMVRGDLGTSWSTGRPVLEELGSRLPATLRLTAASLGLAVAASMVLGLTSAWATGRWPDQLARAVSMVFLVVPGFMLGVITLDLVVVRAGIGSVVADGGWGTVLLPALTLAVGPAASWSRILRTTMLDAKSAPFLLASRARGAGTARRMFVHELPNSIPSYLTVVGIEIAVLLGGAPIVESIYSWPGVGRLTVRAVEARDTPVIVGFVMLAIAAFVVTGLVVDVINAAFDPRRRETARGRSR